MIAEIIGKHQQKVGKIKLQKYYTWKQRKMKWKIGDQEKLNLRE